MAFGPPDEIAATPDKGKPMSEVTRKRVGELQRGVIRILMDHPDGLPAKDVLQRLEKDVPPTDFEKGNYPKHPNVRRFENLVRFVTIGPVKAGWVVKTKGRWYVTEEGRKAYRQIQDPEQFAREATRLYYEWKSTQPEPSPDLDHDTPETAEIIEKATEVASTVEEAEENAWLEIEHYVQGMHPYDFQSLLLKIACRDDRRPAGRRLSHTGIWGDRSSLGKAPSAAVKSDQFQVPALDGCGVGRAGEADCGQPLRVVSSCA